MPRSMGQRQRKWEPRSCSDLGQAIQEGLETDWKLQWRTCCRAGTFGGSRGTVPRIEALVARGCWGGSACYPTVVAVACGRHL